MSVLDGYVHPDYADVASALMRLIPLREAGGAAVCVYHEGRKVVDVWGGTRDREGNPWLEDTTAPSFSTTKGVVSTLIHILVDKGLAAYDDPVAKFWPEFAAHGKEEITIRQVLCHESGLWRIGEMIDTPSLMLDWEGMKQAVAQARPVHGPGEAHGYHALTYGWLAGGLVEAISGKPLQTVLQEELVDPLGLDGFFIGMPHNEAPRRAKLIRDDGVSKPDREPETEFGQSMQRAGRGLLKALGFDLDEFDAAMLPFDEPFDWNAEETVTAMIPGANGQFTARSLARMYAMIAGGGKLEGARVLSRRRVRAMGERQNAGRDRVLGVNMDWRMGYHRVFALGRHAPDGFGHYGYGGSGAWCDPSRELAVALVLNHEVGEPLSHARMARISRTLIKAVDRLR